LETWNLSYRNRVGLFGGTFNPPHAAHLLVAEAALSQMDLVEVVFIPCGIPPHKEVEDGVSKQDRYEMVKRTVGGYPRLSVSRIEIDRGGSSYTIDTVRALQGTYPQGMVFVVGADLLLEIETWKEPDALLSAVPFLVAPRNGIRREAFSVPPFADATIQFLEMEEVDLSSSWVRARVRRGEPIEGWVPPEVVSYIAERGLYGYRSEARLRATGTGGRV
jgi:nicotinate-nucleotide adenylyltransferase